MIAKDSLGFAAGQIVQEFLYDDDVDEQLRQTIAANTGEELVAEDFADVADAAIIWWRSDDAVQEDLADLLVAALTNLDNGGLIWVFTPKSGLPGHVLPMDIEEAARTCGLHPTSAAVVGPNWSGIRISARARR